MITRAPGGADPADGAPHSAGGQGAQRPFFRSRWVPAPAHVRELEPGSGLPGGFRASGVACGMKPSGRRDLGLLVCDAPDAASAARFTSSSAAAAPVQLTRERCRLNALRAVLANSGCANAATGSRGLDDAAKTQGGAALAAGMPEAQVALASTGSISDELPVAAMLKGILEATEALSPDGDGAFAEAIQTTDAFEKRVHLEVQLPAGSARISAQCKGAGMISPRFATMLCFVQTDAQLEAETAELLLGVCVARSFDRITVDGQLSTNDTAILMCSGASGIRVAPESEEELRLGEALDALLRQLAILIVADGEGAGRIARVVARGGSAQLIEPAARAVANSPLVKAALHGGDPNWGRIAQAVGGALPGEEPLALEFSIEGIRVCSAGAAVPYDAAALRDAVQRDEVEFEIGLAGSGAETEVFFSDLSPGYVAVNAEYTT